MRVKELLLEALSRANHIEDGTSASSVELSKARKHFHSALTVYSDNNLITAFQKTVDVTGSLEQVIGSYNMKKGKVMHCAPAMQELPDPERMTSGKDFGQYVHVNGELMFAQIITYQDHNVWYPVGGNYTTEQRLAQLECTDYIPDKIVPDIERVTTAMYRDRENTAWRELRFVPLASFYTDDSTEIYCSIPAGDNKVKLILPEAMAGKEVRLVYYSSMKFTDNSYIELPEVYKELLTLSTTVGLLSEDADSDPTQLANYKAMLEKLEHQVAANNANTRRIIRKDLNGGNSLLHSGRFICRR